MLNQFKKDRSKKNDICK